MTYGELQFIEEQIQQYTHAIDKQNTKINRTRTELLYEPIYEVHVLRQLKAKLNSLKHKREKILNRMNTKT